MKVKWSLVLGMVLCVVVVQTGFAQAQERAARQGRAAAAGMVGAGMYEGLDLTQEQQAKMAEIRASAMEKVRSAEGTEARQEALAQMREQMQNVLTEEQRARIRSRMSRPAEGERPAVERPAQAQTPARPMDPLQLFDAVAPRLELTADQQAKIAKLREDAINKLLADIRGVLNEDQKARLTQAQQRLRAAQAREPRQAAGERPEAGQVRRGERTEGAERAERPQRTRAEGAQRQRQQ